MQCDRLRIPDVDVVNCALDASVGRAANPESCAKSDADPDKKGTLGLLKQGVRSSGRPGDVGNELCIAQASPILEDDRIGLNLRLLLRRLVLRRDVDELAVDRDAPHHWELCCR